MRLAGLVQIETIVSNGCAFGFGSLLMTCYCGFIRVVGWVAHMAYNSHASMLIIANYGNTGEGEVC